MPADDDPGVRKFLGLYTGVVQDNVDPKKLGRVKVTVPGVAEPTGWAFPLGFLGAGGSKRGGYSPPPKGAEVGVLFKMGDCDHPYYLPGNIGEGEAPDEVDASSPEDAVKLPFIFNGDRYKIIVDERDASSRISMEDKKTGDMMEIDGVNGGVHLKASAALSIECDGAVDIKGSSVTINGRKVGPTGKPI